MVKEGLDAQLNALDKMIDKYKKALSNEKDLYEYQRNIAKQTKNIANIQKQIAALTGDNSDEARSKIQKLKVQLEEAQDDLRDTEYNKWYEDQTNMLDDMRDEIADAFDDIIKNHREEIINNLLPVIKASSSNELIQKYMTEFGYKPTSDMQSIINNQGAVSQSVDTIRDRIIKFLSDYSSLKDVMDRLEYLFSKANEDNTTYGNGKEGNDQETSTKLPDKGGKSSSSQPQFDNTPIKAQDRLYEIMTAILNNSKKTDSDTPTSTSFGHYLNDYLNRTFGLALSENDEQYIYQLLRETLGLSPNYSEELTLTKAIELGLFKDLPNLLADKVEQMNLGISSDKFIDGGILAENMNQGFLSAIPAYVTEETKKKARNYLNKLSFPQNEKDEKARTEFAKKYKSAARIKHQWNGKMFKDMSELVGLAKIFGVVPNSATTITAEQDKQLYELLKKSGFSTGGIAKVVKRTGEDGLIGGIRNGEGFVMPEHVPQIQELLKNIPQANMIMEDLNRKFALPVSGGKNVGGTTIGDISVHLDGSNVIDAQTFMDALDNAKVRNKVVKMVGNQIAKPYMNSLSRF